MNRLAQLITIRLRQEVLEWSGSWWFLTTLVVQAVVGPLIGLFVWSAVFPGDPYIISYYVALMLITLMTESFEQFTLAERIYDGTLSHDLLRPQPVVIGVIGANLAIRSWLTIIGIPAVVLTGLAMGVRLDPAAILLALPALPLAGIMMFLWTYGLSLTGFWTERVHAVVGFGSYLILILGGTIAPVELLPEPWRQISRLLPMYGMLGFPAELATGRLRGGAVIIGYLLQLGWIAIGVGICVRLWRAGTRRYTVVGA